MRGKSLALAAIPLRVQRASIEECDDDEEEEEEEENENENEDEDEDFCEIQTPMDLQISTVSPFILPDDWVVEEKPRPPDPHGRRVQVDRYYYEPGSGRKFRSLISVQRHLMEETRNNVRTKNLKSENKKRVIKEEDKQVETQTMGGASSFKLPDDWTVLEKRRKYVGVIDRTYVEPKTGQQFRSLRAVERYLSEDNTSTPTTKPLSKCVHEKERALGENHYTKAESKCSEAAEDGTTLKSLKLNVESKHPKKSSSPKKIKTDESSKASVVNLSSPPAKVNWVLSGTGGIWTPFVDGSKVPESVKLKWSEAFVLRIQDGDTN